jgi:hypothetical protein
MSIKVRSEDFVGTVISHGADPTEEGHASYLIVQLGNGQTVRARPMGPFDYRPLRRGVVRATTTNFFGLKKYQFKGYRDEPQDASSAPDSR